MASIEVVLILTTLVDILLVLCFLIYKKLKSSDDGCIVLPSYDESQTIECPLPAYEPQTNGRCVLINECPITVPTDAIRVPMDVTRLQMDSIRVQIESFDDHPNTFNEPPPAYFVYLKMSNAPHGGLLKDLLARDAPRKDELLHLANSLPSLTLNERQLCDLELILTGGFSPLDGFLSQADYISVLDNLRLTSGLVWTIPINLDVGQNDIDDLKLAPTSKLVLRNPQDDQPLAILTIQDIYRPDKSYEATKVFGKDDDAHPAVHYLHNVAKEFYLGGSLEAINAPSHYDYAEDRFTPAELRSKFNKLNWTRVVAFQTRNPMHRAHRELTVRAARENKCHVLIHPVVGMTKPGDIDHYTRVRVYKTIIQKYPEGMAGLSLLPLAMRMGGPREAVWHAIIRKNHGCTHFIVGRDHAGPGKDSNGKDFYGPYDAQDLVNEFKDELDIEVVPFKMVSYLPDTDEYAPSDQIEPGTKTLNISGTELRRRLKTGGPIPDWFTYPEVQKILRSVHPPRTSQGFTVLFLGHYSTTLLTLANALDTVLNQGGQRPTTLLVPSTKSKVVLPTKEQIETYGFIASQISKNGGAVIASPLIETLQDQQTFLQAIKQTGGETVIVHVKTSLDYIKSNDRTQFYQHHQSSFEAPKSSQLTVDFSVQSIGQIVHEVVLELEKEGFVGSR
ncbi:sulfate adenylyltransferase [Globomyces pollinis-pini]|nr:sulfate adenylyltransferase [Globomyces pollinis-pini]